MTEKSKTSVTRRHFLAGLSAAAVGVGSRPILGANDRIGIGAIGCGGRGGSHLHYLKQLKEEGAALEIAAVCDVYRPRLQRAEQDTGGKPYMLHSELLQDENVDAVLIATPDHWHGQQLLDAVQAGKDAYCEKPISHWRQTALTRNMAKAVRESKQIVQVGVQCMSSSAWRQAAEAIQRGDIGKPLLVQAGYFRQGEWGERMPIDDAGALPGDNLLWDTFLGDCPKRTFSVSRFFQWRLYWDYAGGPSTDLFPHTFTPIVRMLNVDYPSSICASGGRFLYNHEREVPDTFNLMMDYSQGVSVILACTLGNDYELPLAVRGSEGTLTFDADNVYISPQPNSERPRKIDPIQRKESQLDFWRNFLDCCRSREQPWAPIDLALPVQLTLQMGVTSLRERRTIDTVEINAIGG